MMYEISENRKDEDPNKLVPSSADKPTSNVSNLTLRITGKYMSRGDITVGILFTQVNTMDYVHGLHCNKLAKYLFRLTLGAAIQ
jgi:hypothetical protein